MANHDDISIFVCGRFPRTTCQTANCTNYTTFKCAMPLAGKRTGQVCGRLVCASCLRGTDCCPPHQGKR